jgi:hypothetical protein
MNPYYTTLPLWETQPSGLNITVGDSPYINGEEAKRIKDYVTNGDNSYGTSYFIRSSVTGKLVSEADSTGEKLKTFVSANGATLAMQILNWSGANRIEHLAFQHQDASGSSLRFTTESGEWWSGLDEDAEYDAQGNNVGFSDPYLVANDPIDNTSGNISFGSNPYLSPNGGVAARQPPFISSAAATALSRQLPSGKPETKRLWLITTETGASIW